MVLVHGAVPYAFTILVCETDYKPYNRYWQITSIKCLFTTSVFHRICGHAIMKGRRRKASGRKRSCGHLLFLRPYRANIRRSRIESRVSAGLRGRKLEEKQGESYHENRGL